MNSNKKTNNLRTNDQIDQEYQTLTKMVEPLAGMHTQDLQTCLLLIGCGCGLAATPSGIACTCGLAAPSELAQLPFPSLPFPFPDSHVWVIYR